MTKPGITATIMTKDSMATLGACLDSLSFCAKIAVVDDFSSDGTWEYLQRRAATDSRLDVYQNKLTTFSAQRRSLHAHVDTAWMLILDADEAALAGLGEEVVAIASAPVTHVAYKVPMKNLLPPHWPRRAHVWNTQKRFLHAPSMQWPEQPLVHAPSTYTGSTGRLRHGLLHHSFDSLQHILKKQLAYGTNAGHSLAAGGKRTSFAGIVWHTVALFLKCYVAKGMWRFGTGGFVAAAAFAGQAFVKYSVVWEQTTKTGAIKERGTVPVEAKE